MFKIIFFVLSMCSFFTYAQSYRFTYQLKFKLDSTSINYENTNMILDVNPKDVKFFEHDLLTMDSINKKIITTGI